MKTNEIEFDIAESYFKELPNSNQIKSAAFQAVLCSSRVLHFLKVRFDDIFDLFRSFLFGFWGKGPSVSRKTEHDTRLGLSWSALSSRLWMA